MGTDIRKDLNVFVNTRDYNLFELIEQATLDYKKQIAKIRDDYEDKEYFDKSVSANDNSYTYNGMYSGVSENLVNGQWLSPRELFPDSPYSDVILQESPFSDGDYQKVSDLKVYNLGNHYKICWRGKEKLFETLPDNYKFLFEDIYSDSKQADATQSHIQFYQKVLSLLDEEFSET